MLILSRVCAEFHDKNGAVIHRITPAMIGLFHEAPEAIRGNLLFDMLLKDGSIKTPEDAGKDRNLENDPMAGADASGREIKSGTKMKSNPELKAGAEKKPAMTEQKK